MVRVWISQKNTRYQASTARNNTKQARTKATMPAATVAELTTVPPPLSLYIGKQPHGNQKLADATAAAEAAVATLTSTTQRSARSFPRLAILMFAA